MFLSSKNRENPLDVVEPKRQKTFISFKKKYEIGEYQEDKVVYKIEEKKGIIYNYLYIGNAFKLGLARKEQDNDVKTEMMLLQDAEGQLYVTKVDSGRVLSSSKTWSWFEFRTYLAYVPSLNKVHDFNIPNEHLFNINTELEEFTAIGPNIDGTVFEGYKITYLRSLNTHVSGNDLAEINDELIRAYNSKKDPIANTNDEVDFSDIDLDDII